MVYLKDILVSKLPESLKHKKEINPLVINLAKKNCNSINKSVTKELSLEEHTNLYKFILGNYDLSKCKYLNIRPHDQFILGRYWDKIRNKQFHNDSDDEFHYYLWEEIYKPIIELILHDRNYVMSIEINNPSKKSLSFIHFHIVIFNTTNSQFDLLIKKFKNEFSSNNLFFYRTVFNNEGHYPDYAVKPLSYNINQKHFALLYYMGFDKKIIGLDSLLSRKSSYFLNSYKVEIQPKDYSLKNLCYRLFPYNTGCKNILKKNFKKK